MAERTAGSLDVVMPVKVKNWYLEILQAIIGKVSGYCEVEFESFMR